MPMPVPTVADDREYFTDGGRDGALAQNGLSIIDLKKTLF